MVFTQAHTDNASHSQQNSMKNNSFTVAPEAERKLCIYELRLLIGLNDHAVSVFEQYLHLFMRLCGWMFTFWYDGSGRGLITAPIYTQSNQSPAFLFLCSWITQWGIRLSSMVMRAWKKSPLLTGRHHHQPLSRTTQTSFRPASIINHDASVWKLITLPRKMAPLHDIDCLMHSCPTCLDSTMTFNHTDTGHGWRWKSLDSFFHLCQVICLHLKADMGTLPRQQFYTVL